MSDPLDERIMAHIELEERIMAHISLNAVVAPVRAALGELCEEATKSLTEYLKDEYVLVLDDIVGKRADAMVVALLRGDAEVGRQFGLSPCVCAVGLNAGELVAYDNDRIRAAIVEKFREKIATAEMISLQAEVAKLEERVEMYHRREERLWAH